MQDLLPKERRFSFGSIITGILFTLFRLLRLLRSFTLFTLIPLVVIIFIFSLLILYFENLDNSEKIKNFGDALYFTIVTMTTVGFGDVYPESGFGRFITVVMILTRIALIHWKVADLINKRVVKTANPVETVCKKCGDKLPT